MKNLIKVLIVFIFCFMTSIAFAANTPTVQNATALGGDIVDSKVPIYISGDTIDTLTCITKTPCYITYIYWYGQTTVGHLMAIKDASGNMLFPMKSIVANQGMVSGEVRIPAPNGIYMDDLDSGAVLIVIETK